MSGEHSQYEHTIVFHELRPTCAGDLEEVILLELLENATLDFYELVRYQERQQGIVVRVDGDVQ